MPGKISDLGILSDPAAEDLIEVLDVSDTNMAATGTSKRMPLGASAPQTIETQAGTTYAVTAADAGKIVRLTGAVTVTLPSGGPVTGQRVDFACFGTSATFILGSGAAWDVPPTPSAVARATGSFVTAVKMGAAAWALTGDLS